MRPPVPGAIRTIGPRVQFQGGASRLLQARGSHGAVVGRLGETVEGESAEDRQAGGGPGGFQGASGSEPGDRGTRGSGLSDSWIPPNGKRCEFTGLGQAKLYTVLGAGGPARRKVRVANLRTPGATRGQTLFHVGDMLRFLDELANEQAANTDKGAARRSH